MKLVKHPQRLAAMAKVKYVILKRWLSPSQKKFEV